MKQVYVFLLFVTAVLGKPRDKSTSFQTSDSGVCKDKETCAYCDMRRNRCLYDSNVQVLCKRTCGLCPGDCKDNKSCSWCNYNKQRGHCNNPAFNKDCRFTCNMCTGK